MIFNFVLDVPVDFSQCIAQHLMFVMNENEALRDRNTVCAMDGTVV